MSECVCLTVQQVMWLTAVAGGSSVATVGAVTVESAPRLGASTSMLAVAGGTPGRQMETYGDKETQKRIVCQKFWEVSQGCQPSAHLTAVMCRCVGGMRIKDVLKQQKWSFSLLRRFHKAFIYMSSETKSHVLWSSWFEASPLLAFLNNIASSRDKTLELSPKLSAEEQKSRDVLFISWFQVIEKIFLQDAGQMQRIFFNMLLFIQRLRKWEDPKPNLYPNLN